MADMEIRLTKDELLRQMAIQDFWSEIAFQEGYEVAPGYSFDDMESEEIVEVEPALDAPARWPVANIGACLPAESYLVYGGEWPITVETTDIKQAA